jgi:hypothetical protein
MATTTPNYGWDVPTSSDYVKQGAVAIETLGDDIDATLWTALGGAYPGLRLVKKQTIGSGVTSVTVTNCFSATYENYLIKVSGGVASGNTEHWVQLSGITGALDYFSTLQYNSYGSTTPLAGQANDSKWIWCGNGNSTTLTAHVEITSPFLTKTKTYSSKYVGLFSGSLSGSSSGFCTNTASATGFTWTINTGTMTGGTIYVYGYGIS